jgi:hypothetical protein
MKNLRPDTLGILQRIEALSGRPVEFKPDSSLTLRATLQLARNGAPTHVLRYRPANEPLDYWVAYQAGYLLRLWNCRPPSASTSPARAPRRPGRGAADHRPAAGDGDGKVSIPQFAQMTAHWALMNLRSYAIGMRIDQWLANDHPELRSLQAAGVDAMQQENLQLLSKRIGNLSIPVPFLARWRPTRCLPTGCWARPAMRYRIGRPACWTSVPSCSPSATRCRPRPPTTANSSMPGQQPSA